MAELSKLLSRKSIHGKWYNKHHDILSFFLNHFLDHCACSISCCRCTYRKLQQYSVNDERYFYPLCW